MPLRQSTLRQNFSAIGAPSRRWISSHITVDEYVQSYSKQLLCEHQGLCMLPSGEAKGTPTLSVTFQLRVLFENKNIQQSDLSSTHQQDCAGTLPVQVLVCDASSGPRDSRMPSCTLAGGKIHLQRVRRVQTSGAKHSKTMSQIVWMSRYWPMRLAEAEC